MSLKSNRNILIFLGISLATFIKITIVIPYINILLSIGCFYKAYKINELIKNENKDYVEKNKGI